MLWQGPCHYENDPEFRELWLHNNSPPLAFAHTSVCFGQELSTGSVHINADDGWGWLGYRYDEDDRAMQTIFDRSADNSGYNFRYHYDCTDSPKSRATE